MNRAALGRHGHGFTLVEIAIAVVLLSIIAVPVLKGSVTEQFDVNTGETQTEVTEEAKILTTTTVNLIEDILARNIAVVETALATVNATPASTTTTARQSYSANGSTFYYDVTVKEMSHLMNSSGSLVNWRNIAVGTGSAVHVVPQGNSMYKLVLKVYENAVTATPLRTQSFYLPITSCGPLNAYCPTYSGDPVTYYENIANRYGLNL